ncbi:MAG: hypothetical protein HN623_10215 [Bdellovibrionales bacterium]|nr:hypothetical protein [Bdellovibrionales bacterium]
MKKECGHSKYTNTRHEKIFQGEHFKYRAKTCSKCKAVLWDNTVQTEYNQWLNMLYKSKRHLFQVQYGLSDRGQELIEKLNESFPGVEESLLIRAMIVINMEIVEENEDILELVEKHLQSEDNPLLRAGDKINKKLQFKPNGMQEIISYADMIDEKASTIIEESLYRILLLNIKEDPEMRKYWEEVVLRNIEIILKAA